LKASILGLQVELDSRPLINCGLKVRRLILNLGSYAPCCGKPGCLFGQAWINFNSGRWRKVGGQIQGFHCRSEKKVIRIHRHNISQAILGVISGAMCAFALSIAPSSAQEAAFDQPNQNPAFIGGAGNMPGRPLSTSASASENKSNLKHWSSFSRGSSKMFRCVPAGTVTGNGKSYYSRPTCVAPGQTSVKQNNSGPVKRYLAYNVPAGHFAKKSKASASASTAVSSAAPAKKSAPSQVAVLSYSKHPGVTIVTGHVAHSRPTHAVACYSSYH
jgi:hypothetical protein